MQVFVLHGGTVFATREEYLSYLQTKEIDLSRYGQKGWKDTLGERLGSGFSVIQPKMPNAQNAHYEEWRIWFERFFPFMEDRVILVGHSLGAIFLAKYLSENNFPKKIAAVFLIAPPYDEDIGAPIPTFELGSLQKLKDLGTSVHIFHSKDDPVVSFNELAKYQAQLPQAVTHVFEDRQHFNQEEFPELVEEIKKVV